MIHRETLVDGTTCIVDPTAATEVAAVGVWFDRGSRDENPGEYGSTHFIEHLLFKGTGTRSAYDIAHQIDRLGGAINAFTERESVCVHVTVPSESLALAAEILVDQTNNSTFLDEEIERERRVIENELEAAEDDPEEVASDVFAELLWGEHPLGRRVGGTAEEVAALGAGRLREIYDRNFRRRVRLISASGDLDLPRVAGLFSGAFSPGEAPEKRTPPTSKRGVFYRSTDFQHVQVFCAFQCPKILDQDEFHALQIANSAIGDSMGSRLFQSLRERRGLCYSIYSAPSLLSDSTLWCVYASSKVESVGELLATLAEELQTLFAGKLTGEELDDARAQVRGSLKLDALDVEYRMRRVARQALYGHETITVADSASRIATLEDDFITSTFRSIIDPRELFLLGVGPAKGRASFLSAAEAAVDRITTCK